MMVFFHQAATWPSWRLLLVILLLSLLVSLGWARYSVGSAVPSIAGLIHLLFLAADIVLLRSLPGLQLSFGPWRPQAIVLALPRTVAAFLPVTLLAWAEAPTALGMLLLLQLLGSGLLFWGAAIEPFRLSLTQLELPLPAYMPESPPLRLLHISDLHVERLTRREMRLLELVEAARPDLIVLTGDYVNLSYTEDEITHRQVRELLGRLDAPLGVYATLGSPPVDLPHVIPALFDGLSVHLLRDEWKCLNLPGGGQLLLVGLDCTHELDGDGKRLAELLRQAPSGMPTVLLYHSPELMPQASAYGLDLYLCGHTHGGQVRLPGYGALITSSQLGREFVMGHYRRGQTNLYVSRGVGLEGLSAPRVRFLAPPEITLFKLHAA